MIYDPLGDTDFCPLDGTQYDSRRIAILLVVAELNSLGTSTGEILAILNGLVI